MEACESSATTYPEAGALCWRLVCLFRTSHIVRVCRARLLVLEAELGLLRRPKICQQVSARKVQLDRKDNLDWT